MIACDLVRAVLVALMALPELPLWTVCGLLVVVVLLAPPHSAAQGALLPQVLQAAVRARPGASPDHRTGRAVRGVRRGRGPRRGAQPVGGARSTPPRSCCPRSLGRLGWPTAAPPTTPCDRAVGGLRGGRRAVGSADPAAPRAAVLRGSWAATCCRRRWPRRTPTSSAPAPPSSGADGGRPARQRAGGMAVRPIRPAGHLRARLIGRSRCRGRCRWPRARSRRASASRCSSGRCPGCAPPPTSLQAQAGFVRPTPDDCADARSGSRRPGGRRAGRRGAARWPARRRVGPAAAVAAAGVLGAVLSAGGACPGTAPMVRSTPRSGPDGG